MGISECLTVACSRVKSYADDASQSASSALAYLRDTIRARDATDVCLNDARSAATDSENSAMVAKNAANTATSVVIPSDATYSIQAIDDQIATLGILIWENQANIQKIKIEGVNQ